MLKENKAKLLQALADYGQELRIQLYKDNLVLIDHLGSFRAPGIRTKVKDPVLKQFPKLVYDQGKVEKGLCQAVWEAEATYTLEKLPVGSLASGQFPGFRFYRKRPAVTLAQLIIAISWSNGKLYGGDRAFWIDYEQQNYYGFNDTQIRINKRSHATCWDMKFPEIAEYLTKKQGATAYGTEALTSLYLHCLAERPENEAALNLVFGTAAYAGEEFEEALLAPFDFLPSSYQTNDALHFARKVVLQAKSNPLPLLWAVFRDTLSPMQFTDNFGSRNKAIEYTQDTKQKCLVSIDYFLEHGIDNLPSNAVSDGDVNRSKSLLQLDQLISGQRT